LDFKLRGNIDLEFLLKFEVCGVVMFSFGGVQVAVSALAQVASSLALKSWSGEMFFLDNATSQLTIQHAVSEKSI